MSARLALALVGSLAAASLSELGARAPQQQTPPPLFRTLTDAVSVDVSVTKDKTAVTGLTAADFEVLDNGVPQSIQAISTERLPIDVTLMLDVSRSVEGGQLERLKSGVLATARLLTSSDQVRLIAVQHWVHEVFPFRPGGSAPALDTLSASGGTALYDGLAAAMMRPAQPDRRQLIVAYTDGQDTSSVLTPDVTRDVALRSNAVVHILVPADLARTKKGAPVVPNAATLADLAGRTGGQVFYVDVKDQVSDAFRGAITDFRTAYVLRYVPSGVKHGGWHELTVHVKSGQYDVRARRGYDGG
jgi:VWFA-related protein